MHIVDEESRKGLLLYTARSHREPLQKPLILIPYTIPHRKTIFLSGPGTGCIHSGKKIPAGLTGICINVSTFTQYRSKISNRYVDRHTTQPVPGD